MKDQRKTKAQLIEALAELRRRVAELEASETEHERAQEAWRESGQRYRSLFEQSRDAVNITTRDGRLLDANQAWLDLFGYSRKHIAGLNVEELYADPADRRGFQDEMEENGAVRDYEVKLRKRDGTEMECLVTSTVRRGDDGAVVGYQGIIRNITERKEAGQALKEYSERLEEMVEERTKELREAQEELMRKERLAILGQLAGGVSHELRNPLATISNAVYYLQMTLPDADKTTKEYLELIYQQVRSAAKIISDLLDFSRDTTADREEVAVSHLVADLLERHAPPDDVAATTHVPADLPPVFVDARQIGQVLDNLVTNAYQAMPEGGTLTIKTSEVSGKPPRSREVAISITDTGVGIPEENLEKLFEPLFSTKPRGIGLGLAVSKTFVEANRGVIEVESEKGKGSTFTVILPTAELDS